MIANHLIPVEKEKQAVEFASQQLKIFWLPDEIKVEKDIQDVLVNMTPAEKHGVISTLKLFSLYETHAGSEYWGSRFKNMFDGAEFHRMASVFSMFELAVHQPFYNKINELLHINSPDFYLSYQNSPVLVERMKHVDEIINDPDDLVSLAGFSMVEGVILYSSFAFLKHFQSQGKNRLMSIVRGINFSVRDENLHSQGGAWAFRLKAQNLSAEQLETVRQKILVLADKLLEHEKEIIGMIFEKGKIEGVTANQLENFVKSRIDECMKQLGFPKVHNVSYNPIAAWFYKGINDYVFNDFFTSVGNQYHRQWNEDDFEWKADNE